MNTVIYYGNAKKNNGNLLDRLKRGFGGENGCPDGPTRNTFKQFN